VWFETPGRVTVSTGRVEIGQGVLTAMVPELFVELINPLTDLPPLGLGEATGGPTVAAIGNAVAQALGVRIHDLPMTRERVMAALLNKE
jgi:CO/xanthine dehydrogenase Mo-binding subunit